MIDFAEEKVSLLEEAVMNLLVVILSSELLIVLHSEQCEVAVPLQVIQMVVKSVIVDVDVLRHEDLSEAMDASFQRCHCFDSVQEEEWCLPRRAPMCSSVRPENSVELFSPKPFFSPRRFFRPAIMVLLVDSA